MIHLTYDMAKRADRPLGGHTTCGTDDPRIDPITGAVVIEIRPPLGGPLDPRPALLYTSRSTVTSEFGYGWNSELSRKLRGLSGATAQVLTPLRATLQYTGLSGGFYVPPNGVPNSLAQVTSKIYVETQPDGVARRYTDDSSFLLETLISPAGKRWTLTRAMPATAYAGSPIRWVS